MASHLSFGVGPVLSNSFILGPLDAVHVDHGLVCTFHERLAESGMLLYVLRLHGFEHLVHARLVKDFVVDSFSQNFVVKLASITASETFDYLLDKRGHLLCMNLIFRLPGVLLHLVRQAFLQPHKDRFLVFFSELEVFFLGDHLILHEK